MEGQVSVALGALRRAANDHLLREQQTARQRFAAVEGVGTLSVLAPPSPVSLVPVDGAPQRLRFVGTVPLMLSRGPERPRQDQFQKVGSVVAKYDLQADLHVSPEGGGWTLETRAVGTNLPAIELGPLPADLPPALADAATGLLTGMAQTEASLAAQGLVLGRITPWPGLRGPAQLGSVSAAMDGAMLRVTLSPRGRLSEGLDLGSRALDPGAGQDLTVALSPAWLSALANAPGDREQRVARAEDADYRLGITLAGTPPVASLHARRSDTCGFVDLQQPVKIGRTGAAWGIAPKGESTWTHGGAGEALSAAGVRLLAEHGVRLLNDRFLHPVFTAADRRPPQARIIRYEDGTALFDGAIPGAPTALRAPRKRKAPTRAPKPGLPRDLR